MNSCLYTTRTYCKPPPHTHTHTQGKDAALRQSAAADVKRAMVAARKERKPHLNEMFTDVYDDLPPRLQRQQAEMMEMVDKYKEHYGPILSKHES